MEPGECIKRKKKKKEVRAKYSPAHAVLRAGERESKPHVTDVSHVTKCTGGRSQAKKAVREPPQYCCLGSFSFQAEMLLQIVVHTELEIVFSSVVCVKGNKF